MSSDKKKTATKKSSSVNVKVGALATTRGPASAAKSAAKSAGKNESRVTVAKAYKMFVGGAKW